MSHPIIVLFNGKNDEMRERLREKCRKYAKTEHDEHDKTKFGIFDNKFYYYF